MVYKVYAFRYSDDLDIPDSLIEMWRETGGEDPLSDKVTMLQLYWTPGKSWERVAEVVVGANKESLPRENPLLRDFRIFVSSYQSVDRHSM